MAYPAATVDDVDIEVVARLVRGVAVRSNRAERATAAAILGRSGDSAAAIAARVGCSVRSVERYRREIREGRWAT